jgi:hypothetical protein
MLYVLYIRIAGTRATEWVRWLVDVRIPALMETGCFVRATLARDEAGDVGPSVGYRLYLRSATEEDLGRFVREFPELLDDEFAAPGVSARIMRREELVVVSHTSSGV